jgi:hypothetical protein
MEFERIIGIGYLGFWGSSRFTQSHGDQSVVVVRWEGRA